MNLDEKITSKAGSAMFGPAGPEDLRTGPNAKRTLGLGWLLYGFVRTACPELILEVGSGGSSMCLLQGIRDNKCGHLHTVDDENWGPPDDYTPIADARYGEDGKPLTRCHATFLRQLEHLKFNDICTFYHEKSQELGPRWNQPIDMLVVDGDHAREAVEADWNNFAKWLVPGGFAFFHDPLALPYDIGMFLEEKNQGEWTMMIEPDFLSMAIIQRKFTVSSKKLIMTGRLAQVDNLDNRTTPIHLTNARKIPGMLQKWTGRWFESQETFSLVTAEAQADAEKLMRRE